MNQRSRGQGERGAPVREGGLWGSVRNLAGLAKRGTPVVGATPAAVVHTENKWRLLRYQPRPEGIAHPVPILMVPSLINRHYVLDLMPGKSFVEWLVAEGFDVWIIDWGTPGPEDRYVTFEDVVVTAIGRALRKASRASPTRRAHVLGYCLGGTLAAIHAAVNPEPLESLVLLAAPLGFSDEGLLTRWTQTRSFDVKALVRGLGIVPWQLMQGAFHLLKPTLPLAKGVTLLDRAWNDRFLDGYLALETWANDNVSLPGRFYVTYIEDLYRADGLVEGTFRLAGELVRLDRIRCPTLAVSFAHDHIVPEASAAVAVDLIGADMCAHWPLPGSHIGGVTSRGASKSLWPALAQFWTR